MNADEWIGKSENRSDSMAPEQLQRFAEMLNHNPAEIGDGSELITGAHWAYFHKSQTNAELGVSGTPRNDSLIPPCDLPRRMWAGGKLEFKKPLVTGVPAERISTLTDVSEKKGSSGKLCFVTLKHQVSQKGAIAVDEDQIFVFLQENEKGAHPIRTEPMDIDPEWKKLIRPDPLQLFRFSAVTWNSHRIHYDQEYARDVEGYPNLLIHSPYLLILMMDAYRSKHDGKVIQSVEYKSIGPAYLGEQLTISGKTTDNLKTSLRATGPDDKLAMKAEVEWSYSWQ